MSSTASATQDSTPAKDITHVAMEEYLSSDIDVIWKEVVNARKRIAATGRLPPTPIREGRPLPMPGWKVWYKCDNLRMTGAYKERGGLNSLLRLKDDEKKNGIIAASAGNHAQAIAYHGKALGVPVVVVMPLISPVTKVENCRALGAEVILYGSDFNKAKDHAALVCEERKMKYINGYDHPDVICGAGTCGLEIMEQLPNVEVVLVPVGGGGLLSGITVAIKRVNPKIQVIGVESDKCPGMSQAFAAKKRIYTPVAIGGTIADGLAVPWVGINAAKLIIEHTDKVIAFPEHYIYSGILHMLEKEKLLCEGAGACGIAAIFSGALNELRGKNVCVVLTGGNIDMSVLGRVIDRGLYATGRQLQFDVAIIDQPGGFAHFTHHLSKTGACIKDIVEEHSYISDLRLANVHCTIETLSDDHCKSIIERMGKVGYVLKVTDPHKYDDVKVNSMFRALSKG